MKITCKPSTFFLLTLTLVTLDATSYSATAEGQPPGFRRGSFEINLGALQPSADLKGAFSEGFVLGINFGYRVQRFIQLDFGADWGLSRTPLTKTLIVQPKGGGPLSTRDLRDNELLLPVGGRLVLPLARERILISAGGGYSYLRYFENPIEFSLYETIRCSICDSRSGWGPYVVGQIQFVVDRERHFGFGITAKRFQARTTGESLGTFLAGRTQDRWTTLAGTVSFRF